MAIPARFLLPGWGGPHLASSWSACCAWDLQCCSLQIHLWVYSAAGKVGWFVFVFPKKTKLDCDKYVAPNRNMQHLLSNFIWRSYIVNYTGYAITLCFNYIALTCGKAASLKVVMGQGGNRKEGIWCSPLLQTTVGFVRPRRARKNSIFHIMMTSERQSWQMKSLCTSLNQPDKKLYFFTLGGKVLHLTSTNKTSALVLCFPL